jgi:hypothetical protein
MAALVDFFRANAAFMSLALLCYCLWRIRQIDNRTAAIHSLLFRDYEEQFSHRNPPAPSKTPPKTPLRRVS